MTGLRKSCETSMQDSLTSKSSLNVGNICLTISYEVQELNKALAHFFAGLKKENGKDCLDNFALYVINK